MGGGSARVRVAAAGKGSSPDDEGPAPRFRPANGDEDCRSNLWGVPDRSSPSQASSSRGPHHGHDPSPDGISSRCQMAASSATSGGIASASVRLPNRSAWSAVAPATPLLETALLRPPSPIPWPSGEPAVNDCPDTAAVVLGERVPVFDHVLEVGGKCAGFCAAALGECRFFSSETRFLRILSPPLALRPPGHPRPRRAVFWGRMAPAGFFCAASCRGTPIPEEPAAARLVAAGSVVSCGSLQIPSVTCGVGFRVATASDFKSVLSRLNCGRTGAPDPPSASSKWWSRHIRAC